MPGHGYRCTEITMCTTSTRFLRMGTGYIQISTLAQKHSVGWAVSPVLCPHPYFSSFTPMVWTLGPPLPGSQTGLCSWSTLHHALRHSLAPASLWGCLPGFAFSSQAEFKPLPLSLRGWKAQEKASKESPKWRCWQSSNQTPLCHPRADSLGSSHQHCHRNMEWVTHISPSSLKSPLICTPVSLKGGSTWLGSKFANLGWSMDWEWKAGTKLLKVKLDDRFTLPKPESHQHLCEVWSSLLQPSPPPQLPSSYLQEQRFISVHSSEETIHHGEESMVEGASVRGCMIVAAWLSLASLWFRRWERDCPQAAKI